MSKRILALLLALVMMLSLLTACGSTGRRDKQAEINQDGDAVATEPPSDTKATITVATWDGGLGSRWLELAAKEFEEKYADDNIAPTLTVNALSKTEYKVGDVVSVPTYTATDNMENRRVDVILILPDAQVRLLTSDLNGEITYALTDASLYNSTFRVDNTSFRTEQKGTYTLRYVANDDQYNRAVQEFTFTVS